MQRLKAVIEQYSRWKEYDDYIERIQLNVDSDFPNCIEIAKSLLEGIAKKICEERKQPLENNENVSKLMKLAFGSLGYDKANIAIQQIGTSIANIGHQMGTLRNAVGTTAHGVTPEEIERRKNAIKKSSSDFLLASTEIVCCYLIETFETEFPRGYVDPKPLKYEDNEEFNQDWDEQFGEFAMKDYSFTASEILFGLDPNAYQLELNLFSETPDEGDNGK